MTVFLLSILFSVILMFKNERVFRCRKKACDYIFSKPNPMYLLDKHYCSTSYLSMLINPFKWTYKQMFPELEKDGES